MEKDDNNNEIKDAEVVNFSKSQNDLEKTKATLKASMPKPDKRGRNMVNTDEQELFCQLIADGRNQSQAAKMAYPNDKHPRQRGHELMQMQHIKDRVEQLKYERAYAAKLVDPQESLIRWNSIYNDAMDKGDIRIAIEAQKQIDKINGAEAYVVKQQLEVKGMFRGEEEEEWEKSAKKLANLIQLPKKQD